MSDQEAIQRLEAENNQLKKTIESYNQGFNGMNSQLEAHKQVISENVGANINLRSQIISMQKHLQELSAKLESSEKKRFG